MEQDMLTTSEPFDPVMAVYDGALRLKMWPRGLKGIGLVPRPRCA